MKKQNGVRPSLLFLFVSSALLLMISCTRTPKSQLSHEVWLPWQNDNGSYSIQKVSVNTVSEWAPLRGTAAQVRSHVTQLEPNLYSSQEVVMEYSHDQSGALIPSTVFSTEVASIYAHFERLQKVDKELEIPDADMARKVYVKVLATDKKGELLYNNAFYDANSDSYFIVPYRMKGLPISVNGAVIAHEHFHSIFARLLLVPLAEASRAKGKKFFSMLSLSPHSLDSSDAILDVFNLKGSAIQKDSVEKDSVQKDSESGIKIVGEQPTFSASNAGASKTLFLNKAILRGMNEGLADVWGWLYSKDPCFMSHSFNRIVSDERCLTSDDKPLKMTTVESLGGKYSSSDDLDDQSVRQGYQLGSNLAKMIYLRIAERGELNDVEAKKKWARRIVKVLPEFLPHLLKVYVEDEMRLSVMKWEKTVDTLLFGPGSLPVPADRCATWKKILDVNEPLDQFKSQCHE